MARKNVIAKRDSGDLEPDDDEESNETPARLVARSVSALERIAESLVARQDQSDKKIEALTQELAKTRQENRNNAVMNSQAASEAEALNSIGLNLKGPIKYRPDESQDNFDAYGKIIDGGVLPPEHDPRF